MKLRDYMKDHMFMIWMFVLMMCLIALIMISFRLNQALIISVCMICFLFIHFILIYDFYRKRLFYQQYCTMLKELDQKYLICEMVKEPSFLDGQILYHSLYEINKSMIEKMNELQFSIDQFKDYVEMWIHEVKIPLSHLTLTIHNHPTQSTPLIHEQIHKLENQVDLILYYVRSQTAQKDYLIKSSLLSDIVKNVVKKNKDYFIYQKVKIVLKNLDYIVYTDSKWLEFMLNQILNNSFQYTQDQKEAMIEVSAIKQENKIILSILDNGMGIKKSDLPKVFEKSFTGDNGRVQKKSTGMGLYICQKLCQQLGHDICIESIFHEYTKVQIIFYNDCFYDVLT